MASLSASGLVPISAAIAGSEVAMTVESMFSMNSATATIAARLASSGTWQTEIRFEARPVNDLIHRAGFWMLMFVLLSLAITPLQRIARYGQLVDVRRMIGVGAFCYGVAHISLYVVDQMFDLVTVASEIALRIYLTIGFTALTGLAVLAATSTDGMVRALGGLRWRRLHQLIYFITMLALVHFFQQTKLDVSVPTLVTGLFVWLMGYRLIAWRWKRPGELPTWVLLALSVAAAALTFAGEAIGIGIAFHVSPLVVLQTAFDIDLNNTPRPLPLPISPRPRRRLDVVRKLISLVSWMANTCRPATASAV